MVGAVGKISAFRPQGPQFDPGSAKATSAFHPFEVGKWVPASAGS